MWDGLEKIEPNHGTEIITISMLRSTPKVVTFFTNAIITNALAMKFTFGSKS